MSGLWDEFKRDFAGRLDKRSGGTLSSAPVNQSGTGDMYSSPAERGGLNFDGPAPAGIGRVKSGTPASQQKVWDSIARAHPHKFRKAVEYLNWLERMEQQHSRRLL